jgi:hypothetical protein
MREKSKRVEMFDYQLEAIDKMKNGCILCGGVGTGKSRTSLAYFYKQYGGKFNIDVKGSSSKNKQSKSFLFTCKSASGKEYPYSDNHFIAFINYIDKTIYLAADKDVKELASKYKERDSESGDNSKYVLLPKKEVQKLGRTINPSDKIKNLLK